MFDATKPVRNSGNEYATVEILGQLTKADEFRNRPMLVIVTTDSTGAQRIGYRNLDGTHPNGYPALNLVNIDTAPVAHYYQTMDPALAGAIHTLWKHDQFGPAIDVIHGLDPSLDQRDIRHYFEGLFG